MKTPTVFSYALLLSIICSTSCEAVSELKDGVEEHVEASSPLEVSGKSGEVESHEKTADPDHTSAETRKERSSETQSDKSEVNFESKIGGETEAHVKMAVDDKSAEFTKVDDKLSDVNNAAEEMSSERSALNDAALENNDNLSSRRSNKDPKEINEKKVDDQIYTSRETTRSMPYETHEVLLDNKARTAENSEENLEIQAKSDFEAINAEAFGSRRSYSGSPGPLEFVNSFRSGQIFEDLPLPIPNPNPAMLNKIPNDELRQSNTYFEPVSSSEFRPLEQFNSNPFSNSYPYSFQPTSSTPSPVESIRYQEKEGYFLAPKMIQPLDNLSKPFGRYIAETLRSLPPIPYKPYEQNLPFPVIRPYPSRLNQLPTQPPRYYKKCAYCH